MADISAVLASLSSTESSNAPSGATAVGTGLDENLRMLGALLAASRDGAGWFGLKLTSVAGTNTVTGSVAAQGSITMAPTAYATGQRFHFIPAATNTGATTLNVSSLGNKNIFLNGVALLGYEMRKNCPVILEYDGTQMNICGGAHGGDGVPLGSVLPTASLTAPNGFLLCFGQSVLRTDYPDLFGLIGTTYGSADGTHFSIPDLRGRVVAGQDDMGGSSANRLTGVSGGVDGDVLGGTGGEEAHTLTQAELPNITLTTNTGPAVGGGANAAWGTSNSISGTITTSALGSGSAHNVVQPTLILNYIIKT